MKGMEFFGYHGVYLDEQTKGQSFVIDLELFADLKKAGMTDELEDTIDYSQVYNLVKNITENDKFQLLEKLADVISQEIMSEFDLIKGIKIKIKKPKAPINGEFEWMGVEIERFSDN